MSNDKCDIVYADDIRSGLEYLLKIANVRDMPDVAYGISKAIRVLDETKRIPVRKALWMADESTYPGQGLTNFKCSRCAKTGGSWSSDITLEKTYKFCPWCGAEMVGVDGIE